MKLPYVCKRIEDITVHLYTEIDANPILLTPRTNISKKIKEHYKTKVEKMIPLLGFRHKHRYKYIKQENDETKVEKTRPQLGLVWRAKLPP